MIFDMIGKCCYLINCLKNRILQFLLKVGTALRSLRNLTPDNFVYWSKIEDILSFLFSQLPWILCEVITCLMTKDQRRQMAFMQLLKALNEISKWYKLKSIWLQPHLDALAPLLANYTGMLVLLPIVWIVACLLGRFSSLFFWNIWSEIMSYNLS